MTGDWAAARAHHFLRYFLVYIGHIRVSSTVGRNITGSGAEPASLWAGAVCGRKQPVDGRSGEVSVTLQVPSVYLDNQLTEKSHHSSLFCRNSVVCALYVAIQYKINDYSV